MRFCPFCSAENADELAVCQSCGRRLPPLPPRRARNAPPTGVLLPPRASTTTQPPPVTAPRRATSTHPPIPQGEPIPPGASDASVGRAPRLGSPPPAVPGDLDPRAAERSRSGRLTGPGAPSGVLTGPGAPSGVLPGVTVTSAGIVPVAASSGLRAPASPTAPGLTTAPPGLPTTPPTAIPLPGNDDPSRSLAHVRSPGPAAQRREPPDPIDPGGSSGAGVSPAVRRRSDQPLAPAVPAGTHASRVMPSLGSGPRTQPGSTAPPIGEAPARATTAFGNPHAAADPPWAVSPRGPTVPGEPDRPLMPPILPTQPSGASAMSAAMPALPAVDALRARGGDGIEPPPTRIHRPEALVDRPFTPPQVSPIPEIPEPSLVNSARYAVRFAQARWQRRGAIKALGSDIKKDTDALDQVLGALGGVARTAKLDGRVFAGENAAITAAEQRAEQLTREHNDVDARKAEENSKFVDVERERNAKLTEAERMVEEAQRELSQLEAQRKALRDRRKELERRQKAHLKTAEDAEKQTGGADQGDARQERRRTAEQARREAAAIEPERQDADRRLGAIERPINEATARLDAAKAELDAAKRSLSDAREGHNHRLAELDAEQKRKAREIAQAEGEIARRLVTLGTLVNLNRIEDPQFDELYQRIDRLRGAITARTTEIEKLTAEREAYDRGTLVRGVATIGGAIIVLIALIVILRAALSH